MIAKVTWISGSSGGLVRNGQVSDVARRRVEALSANTQQTSEMAVAGRMVGQVQGLEPRAASQRLQQRT